MTLIAQIKEWAKAHSTLPDEELAASDAGYAERIGLPTLAALIRLRSDLERTPRGRALSAEYITPLVHVATGEATERMRVITGDERVSCPSGIGAVPSLLMEREYQVVTVEQAVALCDEWSASRGHSAPSIRSACARGDLPAELRGKVWYITIADLRDWAMQRR